MIQKKELLPFVKVPFLDYGQIFLKTQTQYSSQARQFSKTISLSILELF